MPAPLAVAGIGLGVKVAGNLLSDGGSLPDWFIKMLREEVGRDRRSGFLPDREASQADLESQLSGFLAELPVAQEQFNADLTRRGLYSASEAPQQMYRTAYAPIARAGTSAITRSNLAYARAYQTGMISAEQLRMQYMGMLGNALGSGESAASRIGGTVADVGDFAMKFGLMQEMGLWD